jgi:hypothetical protein
MTGRVGLRAPLFHAAVPLTMQTAGVTLSLQQPLMSSGWAGLRVGWCRGRRALAI